MMKRFMLVIGLVLLWGVVFPNANAASLSEQQKKENRRREMIRANSRTRNQGIGFVVEPPKKEPQTYTRPSEPIKFEFRGSTNVSHAVFNDLYKDTVLSQYANNGRYFYNRKIPRWVNSGSQKNIQMVKAISNQTYVVIEDAQNLFVLRLPTFVCPCRFDFLEPIGLLTRQTPARYSYQDEKGYIKSVPILEGEYVLSMSDKAHPAITEAEANDLFEKGYRFVLLGQLTDTTQYLYGIRSNNTQQGTLDDLFVADTNINTNELLIGTGTGTAISRDGLILTAHHVIKNAKRIMIETQQGRRPAIVVGANSKSDIALLKCEGADLNPIPIADSKHVRVGQSVFTVGFPQIRVQGVKPKFTKGEISGYCGIADDPTSWQISVPLQPGNSGGPLVDGNGNVIGIVVASLSPYSMFEESGSLPQNVNYAVKSECFSALLTQNNVPSSSFEKPAHSDIDSLTVETVMKSVVLILVYGGNL